jgi:ADP-heptose:LPS heptosyltransferase
MPRRQRWTPVKGTGTRVVSPVERALIAAADLPLRAFASAPRLDGPPLAPEVVREILVLRLDRIGDVLMSLPALADLRAAYPAARLRLAVGQWSEEIARRAPVDEVLVWSAPWVGRPQEGAVTARALWRKARALRGDNIDLAFDLQGDVRAAWLMSLTGARERVGYANTGGARLLTRVVALDETISWVEQNRLAVAAAAGASAMGQGQPVTLLGEADRARARDFLRAEGLEGHRPLIGLHASGGRAVKQWGLGRWQEVAGRLQREFGAAVLLTGSTADKDLARQVGEGLEGPMRDLTGRLSLLDALAVIGALDLFLSSDTGPMHMAAAVGTPSVSVFGPSDARRYFSGGTGAAGTRHVVVQPDLWCAPCNLIRTPPEECRTADGPECLRLVTTSEVLAASAALLTTGGFPRRAAGAA